MKKVMGFLGALIMTCTLLPFSAMAYIERGTVQISCDAEELTLGVRSEERRVGKKGRSERPPRH